MTLFLMDPLHRKPYKRLQKDEIIDIIRLRNEGLSVSSLAIQFNISERQIHRVLKQDPKTDANEENQPKHTASPSLLQNHHSAWLYEELLSDPHITLDSLSNGLYNYFNLEVSPSTVWRHIRNGGMKAHGFDGLSKDENGQKNA